MGGLGVVGMNHTEADLSKRFSPVLQLTNRPEHGILTIQTHIMDMVITCLDYCLVQRMGPAYNNANQNDVLLSAITNEIHQNSADYSSFQIGPLNKANTSRTKPCNWFISIYVTQFPTLQDYSGPVTDAYVSINFSTFRASNIITAQPWANVGTRRFDSYEVDHIDIQAQLVVKYKKPPKMEKQKQYEVTSGNGNFTTSN